MSSYFCPDPRRKSCFILRHIFQWKYLNLLNQLFIFVLGGCRRSSAVEDLPSMCKGLGSVDDTAEINNHRWYGTNWKGTKDFQVFIFVLMCALPVDAVAYAKHRPQFLSAGKVLSRGAQPSFGSPHHRNQHGAACLYPNTWKMEAWSVFKVIFNNIASLRLAWTTYDPATKISFSLWASLELPEILMPMPSECWN